MPVLWRYLLQSYLRVFFLSVGSFVGVLFVLRFKDIARFAALSADGVKTGLFVLYQFPHILPIAIPISALIASFLLFQRLSRTYELTALRASGLGWMSLMAPLLAAALGICILNFSICAELSPYCRRESKTLLYRKTAMNPLLLLQRQPLLRVKNVYVNLEVNNEGQSADNFVCIGYNDSTERLHLIHINHLEIQGDELIGRNAAILSHVPNEQREEFDCTLLENQESLTTSAALLTSALKGKRPTVEPNALNIKQLNLQRTEIRGEKKAELAWIEILRRYSLGCAALSFTLLGCAFGVQTGRMPNQKTLLQASLWTALVFASYLMGKSLKSVPFLAMLALLAPHPLLWAASLHRFRKISRGET